MNRILLLIYVASLILAACQPASHKGTIAELRHMQIEFKQEKVENGLDKAMLSYQDFLNNSPESDLTPEALRRLADLKIEKEYGCLIEGGSPAGETQEEIVPAREEGSTGNTLEMVRKESPASAFVPVFDESEEEFEHRAPLEQWDGMAGVESGQTEKGINDLEREGAREALALYTKLLNEYPLYEHNDKVLYQMSRAYEELGQIDEAIDVMERLFRDFPGSSYIAEIQFRRAEYYFSRRRYLEAEDAYSSIVDKAAHSTFFELALYKLGWTFYKQELYEDALHPFIALLDHKVTQGYDFTQIEDEQERKRLEDTFRVISLSFSNLGGPDSVVEYFSEQGKRSYEDSIYSNLGEFYFDKRRYADAASAYTAFISRNPYHRAAPAFHMRVIEIHTKGGF
ncbi:MAG: tetratricopeptide repeat protein, partial [Deltaproteobacteria bacterium]|nr:tetratricopeptide repeat protein [Deltaproteobacteria bacterium]